MTKLKTLPPARTATIGGVGVITMTALAAMTGMGANYHMEPIDWFLLGLIACLGLWGGIALARMIRADPNAIGEARFDTTNKDEPPAR
jgi:hypothetical protein